MNRLSFLNGCEKDRCVLGEGAIIERLRRNSGFELDPYLANSNFIYEPAKRAALEKIYRQYLDIGRQFDLPLLISTPTWRANRERIEMAGCESLDINADNFKFLHEMRLTYSSYAEKIIICGLMSCRGHAYDPEATMTPQEAFDFHSWQAEQLAKSNVDFLLAATLPELGEATGLARALAKTGRPYVVSFVVRASGTLLDGTPLHEAVAAIDSSVSPPPDAYMINCTHASFASAALKHPSHASPRVRQRFIGLLANTAALAPEELDDSPLLVEEDPMLFGSTVARLRKDLGFKILGGCCGTDERHIYFLAKNLKVPPE